MSGVRSTCSSVRPLPPAETRDAGTRTPYRGRDARSHAHAEAAHRQTSRVNRSLCRHSLAGIVGRDAITRAPPPSRRRRLRGSQSMQRREASRRRSACLACSAGCQFAFRGVCRIRPVRGSMAMARPSSTSSSDGSASSARDRAGRDPQRRSSGASFFSSSALRQATERRRNAARLRGLAIEPGFQCRPFFRVCRASRCAPPTALPVALFRRPARRHHPVIFVMQFHASSQLREHSVVLPRGLG